METHVYAAPKGVPEVPTSSATWQTLQLMKVILQQKQKGVNCTLLTAARTGLDLFDRNLAETLLNVVSTVQHSSTSRLLEKIKIAVEGGHKRGFHLTNPNFVTLLKQKNGLFHILVRHLLN